MKSEDFVPYCCEGSETTVYEIVANLEWAGVRFLPGRIGVIAILPSDCGEEIRLELESVKPYREEIRALLL